MATLSDVFRLCSFGSERGFFTPQESTQIQNLFFSMADAHRTNPESVQGYSGEVHAQFGHLIDKGGLSDRAAMKSILTAVKNHYADLLSQHRDDEAKLYGSQERRDAAKSRREATDESIRLIKALIEKCDRPSAQIIPFQRRP